MPKGHAAPVVRHLSAPDPDPEKVKAAIALWRRALAEKFAQQTVSKGSGSHEMGQWRPGA